MFAKIIAVAFVALTACSSCEKTPKDPDAAYQSLKKLEFSEDNTDFANPERGFLSHKEFKASGGRSVISDYVFESQRELGRTLMYTIYYLDSFFESPISDDYLAYIRANLDAFRAHGFKCVLRFSYKRSYDQSAKPWDPTWEVISGHIDQLTPIFREYADVLMVLEAGFIGTFGEWYYTTTFGFEPKTVEDYQSRRELTDKLLAAVPASRQIAIRYPAAIMGMYDIALKDTLTQATAHNGSVLSRLAHHNDCFVSSRDDVGTYHSRDERPFVYANTRYTIWGGETCSLIKTLQTHDYCLEMSEAHHMTYLNDDYNKQVLQRWKDEDCYDEISLRMGYRLVLDRAFVTPEPAKGKDLRVVLKIRNVGFAAPQNPRAVEIVLTGPETLTFKVDADPRFWFENMESTLDATVKIPETAKSGTYTVSLNLPDPEPTIHDNPRFSIRLANVGTWDEEKGLNKITQITL